MHFSMHFCHHCHKTSFNWDAVISSFFMFLVSQDHWKILEKAYQLCFTVIFSLVSSLIYFQIKKGHSSCPNLWKYDFVTGWHFSVFPMAGSSNSHLVGTPLGWVTSFIPIDLKVSLSSESWPKTFIMKVPISLMSKSHSLHAGQLASKCFHFL